MVFVPFTGIDNHRRCVTFGAALLAREDADSYTWLLKNFLETFLKPPVLILSDQCPAMKIAVEKVLPSSRHRLCMWHITSKLSNKVCSVYICIFFNQIARNKFFRTSSQLSILTKKAFEYTYSFL